VALWFALFYYRNYRDQVFLDRPLIDWLDYNGYTVVTKATKNSSMHPAACKVKGNMDIELAVDAMEAGRHIDHMVLFGRR
jgi:uncharacterized LabA/DUF88 family protein